MPAGAVMATLEMTWQPQQQRRRKAAPPLGLKNLGNTCYLNSVLQCLTYTPPLAQFCLNSQHSSLCKTLLTNREKECPFCLLERQIARSLSLDGTLDAPSKISRGINLFAEHFRWGRQEDAHEFLRYVIDACHNTCLKLLKRLGAAVNGGAAAAGGAPNGNPKLAVDVASGETGPCTVMKEIFGGVLLSQVKCLACKGESNKTDEIMDISLDLFQSNSLKDALSRFFQPEILDGDNKYNCGKCKKMSVARKQMFVLRAPNVLVIQLKRFEGIHGGKINRNIEFEEALVLSNFMYNTSQDSQPEYNLFGSIVHSGFSPESGHYYAYIKDACGRWYCCNDAHVSLSCAQEVLSEKVYILFYLRSNQRPTSRKTTSLCSMMKSSDSNGTDLLQSSHSVELLKPPIMEPNGVYSKNNISTALKNGKVSLNPHIIPINLKNREMKGTVSNGNGKVAVQNHASVAKNNRSLECNSPGENKIMHEAKVSSAPYSKAADGKNSSDMLEHSSKQILSVPNGNGCVKPLKAEVHEDNGAQYAVEIEREFDCNRSLNNVTDKDHASVSSFKRKSCDIEKDENLVLCPEESSKVSEKDVSSKSQSTDYERHPRYELEKFKDMLAREASSELQSCGWVDKVLNFMRSKKRLCVEAEGSCPDFVLLRKQLIIDARKTFLSQIPESLKEHLIARLRSYDERKPLLNA